MTEINKLYEDMRNNSNMSGLISNLRLIIDIYKKSWELLNNIKEMTKYNKETLVSDYATVEYSTYKKYVPVDMDTIIDKYPIAVYPEMYKVTLKAEAADIIKEPWLLDVVEVEKCTPKIKDLPF